MFTLGICRMRSTFSAEIVTALGTSLFCSATPRAWRSTSSRQATPMRKVVICLYLKYESHIHKLTTPLYLCLPAAVGTGSSCHISFIDATICDCRSLHQSSHPKLAFLTQQCAIADDLVQMPKLTMTLGRVESTTDRVSFIQLCTSESVSFSQFATFRKDTRGMRLVTSLFQNAWTSCIPILDQVTSFRFKSDQGPVSFCMDDISLLPSTLQPASKLAASSRSIRTGHAV